MNLLYDLLGWQGGRWAQATAEIWREIPVLTTVGRYVQADGQLTGTLDESGQAALERYRKMEYFYGTNFQYD